ncbi:MAG: competence/damage-inducible protein A [Limisphaerales bacterium]
MLPAVTVELLNTGSELMLGRVLNTHQQWICRRLADLGWPCNRQTAVPDTGAGIRDAAGEALGRADWVITTGGLGPTSDDVTRDYIAELLGRELVVHEPTLERIRAFFAARNRPMPARVEIQAQVPEGAIVLPNQHGTAPGLALPVEAGRFRATPSWLVMLPGPPRELRPMFDTQLAPLLQSWAPHREPYRCVTLRTCGLGESWLEERLAPVLPPLLTRGLEIGYCARTGEVDVRLVTRGPEAASLADEAITVILGLLGEHVFGRDEDRLEEVVIRLATERGARLAVAESCTGGYVAHRLTNVPGASAAFWGGWVTYDNDAKQRDLGISAALLAEHGAVSEACAQAMAEGALARSPATHALALTGIAGPTGGTESKPVGTVFIALARRGSATQVRRCLNPFDRETFKYVSSQQALEWLRRDLGG